MVRVEGIDKNEWTFEIHELPDNHIASIAYGPAEDSIQNFGENINYNIQLNDDTKKLISQFDRKDFITLDYHQLLNYLSNT